MESHIVIPNTTRELLGAGETFTGQAVDALTADLFTVQVYADPPDATGYLIIEFSQDGTNWDYARIHDILDPADVLPKAVMPLGPYFRIQYVNGAVPQTAFRLTTIRHENTHGVVQAPAFRPIRIDDPVSHVKAVLATDQGGSSGEFTDLSTYPDGILPVRLAKPLTAFGEVRTAEPSPVVQIDGVYGLWDNVEATTSGTGSVSFSDQWEIQTGLGANAWARLESRRSVRYRTGQGALFRYTALFTTGVANSEQLAGAFNRVCGYGFGYDGEDFGILYRNGGAREIVRLEITNPAGAAENVTITLDGVSQIIPVTAGTAAHNAHEIATAFSIAGWDAHQNDGFVTFLSNEAIARGGANTATSTGVFTGTMTELQSGVVPTDTWVAQADWNIDPMDGTGPTGQILDPTLGNVYQIALQYLGYGAIVWSVENAATGSFEPVHRLEYANANTTPNLTNPTLRINYEARSKGSTTNLRVRSVSGFGAVEGKIQPTRNPRGISNEKSVSGALLNVLSIRIREEFRGTINLTDVYPQLVSAATAGNKSAVIRLLLNATLGGTPNWTYIDQDDSVVEYDTAGTTVAGGDEIITFVVGPNSSEVLTISQLSDTGPHPVHLQGHDTLTIAAVIPASVAIEVTAAATWLED